MIMDRLYGGVCYAGIDTDPELKYPKGAGRVAFSNQQSYIAAISARFVQLQHGDIDKRVHFQTPHLSRRVCDSFIARLCVHVLPVTGIFLYRAQGQSGWSSQLFPLTRCFAFCMWSRTPLTDICAIAGGGEALRPGRSAVRRVSGRSLRREVCPLLLR